MNRPASLLLAAALLCSVSTATAQLIVRPNVAPTVHSQLPDVTQYVGTAQILDLSAAFRDPDASAAVQLTTSLGVMNFTLDGETAPITVANFLRYVDEGRYFIHDNAVNQQASLFFHRSVPGFVIQSGGFMGTVSGSGDLLPSQVPTFAPIQNEPVISNRRATIAMAKLGGDPNSATSQWFINLADNSANLDFQNGGFSVFGRVAGNGMTVADAIAALPVRNFGSPFDQLPVRNYTSPNPARVENLVSIPGFSRISPFVFTATSNDPGVAEVSTSGSNLLVTAKAIGAAQITVTATDLDGAAVAQSFTLNVIAEPGRLRNIATRARIPAGDEVMIGGFLVGGGTSHYIAVRAIGPSLAAGGVADPIADPTIELHGPDGLIAANDDWQQSPNRQLIQDFGLAPNSDKESVVFANVPGVVNGATGYTAVIRSKGGTSGVGLVEVYYLQTTDGARLLNLSTRGPVNAVDPLVGGTLLRGTTSGRILVRALGPSLPAEVGARLQNPKVQLINAQGVVLDENDDWQTHPNASEIQDRGVAPENPAESALVTTLPAGDYTAVVFGADDGSGIALVELYHVQ